MGMSRGAEKPSFTRFLEIPSTVTEILSPIRVDSPSFRVRTSIAQFLSVKRAIPATATVQSLKKGHTHFTLFLKIYLYNVINNKQEWSWQLPFPSFSPTNH